MDLSVEAFRIADALSGRERYALRDQLLRSAVSIPANIAEGHGRLSKADFVRHLIIARGSLNEFETLLRLTQRLGKIQEGAETAATNLADEVGRMLMALIKKLGTRRLRKVS